VTQAHPAENKLRGVQREVGAMSDNKNSSKSDSSRGSSKEQEEDVEDREDNESHELTTQEQADRAQVMEEAWEISGLSDLKTMDDSTLGSVTFPHDVVQDVQTMWNLMLEEWGSREMAGENFFTVLFDAAPSLQIMFKSPKAVTAMRFMAGLGDTIAMLGKPAYLRKEVEAMAFRHLEVDVSLVRADFFRESMLEMLDERFGAAFTINARIGFHALINYCGGAFVYVRREYAGRIRTITNSWNVVQKSEVLAAAVEVEEGEVDEAGEAKEEEQDDMSPKTEAMSPDSAGMDSVDMIPAGKEMKVPTTFNEMLLFNASVMGYGSSTWMNIVLQQFDDMVKNVANFGRLQEECDVMSLVLAKYKGRINLPEFKAVTLASLRSLLPAEWDSEHEVAWGWLWENIEGLLSAMLGKPKQQEDALERCFSRMSEADFSLLRSKLFPVFLETNPAAQSYVTQSATRINFVAEKILGLTLELYRAPRRLVEEISAVGLRHVGYGIPTEVFPHFVSSSVEILQTVTQVELVIEAFRWSLALLSKIMMRTISEGSTLVMKAINANQKFQLKKAMEVCARGQRAKELLNITAGTQSISPFYWAIDSGALVCAQAILEDLLTIRADRDVYYYGVDALFTCHPECIQKLCARAPTLMSTLLNGLVWRSRQTKEGMRRVNYYVKHLIQTLDGSFSPNLERLVEHSDPKTIRHPTVILFSDVLWHRLASYKFILSKIYFILILGVFITGQSALLNHKEGESQTLAEDITMFSCRVFNYIFSMCKLIISQTTKLFRDLRNGDTRRCCGVSLPAYLFEFQEMANVALLFLLMAMCTQEPYLWCLNDGYGVTMACDSGQDRLGFYTFCAFLAMMLYWALLSDLAIFSMRISAFVLVCGRVVIEVMLFLTALLLLILAFCTAISTLYYEMPAKEGAHVWLEELTMMALGMYSPRAYQVIIETSVLVTIPVCLFLFIVSICLTNLLVAQLSQSYHDAYSNMQGYARLNRASITNTTVQGISVKRWTRFLESLKLDDALEFNEGDVGLSGGIQVLEPSNAHIVTEDTIKRFGGSTAPTAPWPKEAADDEEEDKLALLEQKLQAIIKAQKKGKQSRGQSSEGSQGASSVESS